MKGFPLKFSAINTIWDDVFFSKQTCFAVWEKCPVHRILGSFYITSLGKDGEWVVVEMQIHANSLPETNIALEDRDLEKEIPIGNHHF